VPKRFLLLGNSTYLNRGSEAIVRGTVEILTRTFDAPEFVSAEMQFYPYTKTIESDRRIVHRPIYYPPPRSPRKLVFQATKALLGRRGAYERLAQRLVPTMAETDAVLLVGGDNFQGTPYYHLACSRLAMRQRVPTVLWGASVGPFGGSRRFRRAVFAQLRALDGIFVREASTQEYLAANGVTDNVHVVDDPAFLLSATPPDNGQLPEPTPEGALGVSLSCRFLRRTPYADRCADGVFEIVEAIRQRLGRPIVLIPHCVVHWDDDHDLLAGVLEANRTRWPEVRCLPRELPAAQIKWVVSQLDAVVAARMHCVIGALDACVPAVSLACGFKGEGMNRRVYGSLEHVVRAGECTPIAVAEQLEAVLTHRADIHAHLAKTVPELRRGAMRAGQLLQRLLAGEGGRRGADGRSQTAKPE